MTKINMVPANDEYFNIYEREDGSFVYLPIVSWEVRTDIHEVEDLNNGTTDVVSTKHRIKSVDIFGDNVVVKGKLRFIGYQLSNETIVDLDGNTYRNIHEYIRER